MTTTADPAALVAAWNSTHKPGLLVQWRRTADADWSTGVTWTDALLQRDTAVIRLTSGQFVPLDGVRPHPATARLADLDPVDVGDLDFPPPDCEFCQISTHCDGDGFVCPQCAARWSSNGTGGVRPCVECRDSEAEVLGDDQQPRCLPCAAEVLDGVLDATGPYRCRRCSGEVVGIGSQHGAPWVKQLCGMCSESSDRDADMERWRAEYDAVKATQAPALAVAR